MKVVDKFTLEQAAKVARISTRRATYWAANDVLVPSIAYDTSHSPHVYLYDFVDVVGLRTLAMLRDDHNLSLQSLRRAHSFLREHAKRPWSQLRFWVRGKDLLFKDPISENIISPSRGGQTAIAIELEPVARAVQEDAQRLAKRNPADIGQTQRNRNVQHNQLVVKGTRIPVQSILNLSEDGYRPEDIVQAYPVLTLDDVNVILGQYAVTLSA